MRGKETHGWVGGDKNSQDLHWEDKNYWDLHWGDQIHMIWIEGTNFHQTWIEGTKSHGTWTEGDKNHRTWNEGTKLLTEPSALRGHHFSVLVPSSRGTWTEVTINSASQIASPPCSLQLQQSARGRFSLSLSLLRSACDSMQILSFPDTIWRSATAFVCAIAVAECASNSAMQETVDQ
jgi:hypothetical protein